MLAFIVIVKYKSRDIVVHWYKFIALDNALQYWLPYFLKNKFTLEEVQRRMMTLILELFNNLTKRDFAN